MKIIHDIHVTYALLLKQGWGEGVLKQCQWVYLTTVDRVVNINAVRCCAVFFNCIIMDDLSSNVHTHFILCSIYL